MKHVLRKIQKGASLVTVGGILLTANACNKEEAKNNLKVEELKKEVQEIKNIVTSEDLMAYILSSDSINELKERINIVKNSEDLSFIEKDILKAHFNKLVNKYFKEEDRNKLSIDGTIEDGKISNIGLMLNIKDIDDKENLKRFLDELQEHYIIYILQIDYKTLSNLDYEFETLNQLTVESNDENVGKVDLGNFKSINFLSLIDVNATNIPNTLKTLDFGSKNHNINYQIDDELREIPNLPDLNEISFYSMNVPRVSLPIIDNIHLEFFNCIGDTTIYNTSTDILTINNNKYDYSNFVTVKGKVNNKLEIYTDEANVVLDKVEGEFELSYSPIPEVEIIGGPTRTR